MLHPARNIVLKTERLVLRPFTEADAARVCEIQSNWSVARMLSAATFPPDIQTVSRWLESHRQERLTGKAFRFAAVRDGFVVGCVDIDRVDGEQGVLGYWLDEAVWRKGFATEAGKVVVAFAFETLGVREIVASHAEDNSASAKVLTRLGFQFEGKREIWSKSRSVNVIQRVYRLVRGA
jgi:[ribosomal protein S5]-alanine N-acetyltransferase